MRVALPKDRYKPCKAGRGWFYVNPESIDVVADPKKNGIITVTRTQLLAALKIMRRVAKSRARKRRTSDRTSKP
jgi:hypothetical protein